jgi:lipopolysaccharide transport system ATP-binding protein
MIRCQSPDLIAPDGSIIALIDEAVIDEAAVDKASGSLTASGAHPIGPEAPLPAGPGNYMLEFPLARAGRVERAQTVSALLRLRDAGSTFIIRTHDEPLIEACADEVWWTAAGSLIARGDPGEVLGRYRAHCAAALRAAGEGRTQTLQPRFRAGDGRATLEAVELLGASLQPSVIFLSGEEMTIAVTVGFAAAVAAPVVGILIRTRIGLNVYGTNTELEGIRLGPVSPGDRLRILYRFPCRLCPGDYTVTAASHDPDGLWHDWAEDAVAFAVTDGRYTAGVANLAASVTLERLTGRG